MKSTKHNIDWIARKLGIAKATAQSAIERMERLGYLAWKKNKWVLTTGYLSSTDEEINLPLKRANSEALHMAQEALDQVALELRDFTTVTMAVDPQKIKDAKKLIREFRDRIALLLNTGETSEVYKMCIQLFPLSKGEVK